MRAQAKGRIAQWQSRHRATERKLAEPRLRIQQLQERVQKLEQENAGLKQRNNDPSQAPFGKRSEKRKGRSEGEAG